MYVSRGKRRSIGNMSPDVAGVSQDAPDKKPAGETEKIGVFNWKLRDVETGTMIHAWETVKARGYLSRSWNRRGVGKTGSGHRPRSPVWVELFSLFFFFLSGTIRRPRTRGLPRFLLISPDNPANFTRQ